MKTLLLTLLFLPIVSQAQISPNVSKHYPAHIVYKIDDLITKISLDEEKQIKVAEKFRKIDSITTLSLAQGIAPDQLKANYAIDKNFLKNILSVEELEKFSYQNDKDNRFLAALINAPLLKLEPSQISQIRHLNDSLDTTPKRILKKIDTISKLETL